MVVKTCSKCSEEKGLSSFYKDKTKKDGLRSACKCCVNVQTNKYIENNKTKVKQFQHDKYLRNKDRHLTIGKLWRENNRGTVRSLDAKRRAVKLKATTAWSEYDEIKNLYSEAKKLELITGDKYHIDHIVPLQGKNVCGLHVLANLDILEATENLRKSNTWQSD